MDSVDDAHDALDASAPDRRREAARTLYVRARGDPVAVSETVDALHSALEDANPIVRGHALATLSVLSGGDEAELSSVVESPAGEIVDALGDSDDRVRQTAVGLVSAPETSIPEDLRPNLAAGLVDCLDDGSDLIRLRAAETISASMVVVHPDPDRAVRAVVDALDDDRTDVRTNVGETVAKLAIDHGDRLADHEDRLWDLLESDRADVRASIGFSLAALDHEGTAGGDPEGEEALRTAVDGLCEFVPVEERWAGSYWMRQLLRQWIQGRPDLVATAIESHDGTHPDLERLARRIRIAQG